jgi:hypothetical protein
MMTMLRGTRRALLGGNPGVTYLLRATFDAADQGYADAQVLDTFAEGIRDGQLTVVETDGTLAIVSNECATTAQASAAWGDLGFYSGAITKALGRGLLGTVNLGATNTQIVALDLFEAAGLVETDELYMFLFSNDGILKCRVEVAGGGGGAQESGSVFSYSASTDYELAILMGGYDSNEVPWYSGQAAASYLYGVAFYIKGGTFTTWTLLWRTAYDNTSPLYAGVSSLDVVGTIDDFRVPDVDLSAVLQPTCLSTFTAANGTSLDAITPEVGGAWTEQNGDWDVQSNRANPDGAAIATVDSGLDDAIVDCVVNGGAGDQPAIVLRYSGGDYWYLQADRANNQLELHELNGGDTVRANAAVAIANSTDYDIRAIAYSQTVDGFLDGANKISYGSAALNENVTVHGIRAENTAGQFDNWACFPRTSAVFDTELDAV